MAIREFPTPSGSLVEQTVEAVFDTLPLGLSARQSAAAAGRLAAVAARHPKAVLSHASALLVEGAKVAVGASDVEADARDRRFTDEWFTEHPVYRRSMQGYLAWHREVYALLEDLELDPKSRARARFLLGLVTEAAAPTNAFIGNPAALKEAWRSRGRSVISGLRHLAWDVRNNGGLPSMVDTRPFVLGETIAATPGAVVFRSEVLELIQYTPQTDTVHERPLVIAPPQINKYYILDLAPERSLIEHAVRAGQQVFAISWRNPDAAMAGWDLDTYLTAVLEAIDVARSVTGSPDVNLLGVCAGGITTAALLGHMAATGDDRVHAATFLVTVLDWSVVSTMGTFVSGPTVGASIERSAKDGVLKGADLNRLFAFLRPGDLVWNYWVNNYLLGRTPPSFDVLAWNVDSTDLPAGLHADFMHIASENLMTEDAGITALGTPVRLGDVENDTFVVGAVNDHITPWEGCYETTRLLGGDNEFVLSSAGHIVAMVNPPGSAKSAYLVNPDGRGQSPEAWREGSTRVEGTWWDRWVIWMAERSGARVPAPEELGGADHRVIMPAPGSYVRA